jgi:hypothetical protein
MNWIANNSKTSTDLVGTIAAAVEQAGSDHIPLFAGTWEGGYWIQQQPDELARLVCLLAAMGPFKSSLEIGIAAGGTTRFIRDFVTIENTLVIDDGKHPRFPIWQTENKRHVANLYESIIDSHSGEARQQLTDYCYHGGDARKGQFDLVGIDGDHSAEGIRSDWELVKPFLAAGAVVWFHDIIAVESVKEFWHELRTKYTVMLETDKLGIGVIRFS